MKEIKFLEKKNIEYIIVHCSDTDNSHSALDIHKLHLKFGWDGIGYHKIITRTGKIEQGRPEYWRGAHVKGLNDKSLGVCLIGKSNFTHEQFEALKEVLLYWKKKYPNTKVIGHRDTKLTNKTCPNFDVTSWYKKNLIQTI